MALERDEGEELKRAIHRLAPELQELWNRLIRGLDGMNRLDRTLLHTTVGELVETLGLPGHSATEVRLIIASESTVESCGADLESGSVTIAGTDVVVASSVDKSAAVNAAAELSSFVPGTARQVVASAVLKPLAARSGTVTVLDPHLFDHVLGTARPRRVKSGNTWVERPADHVEWLVSELSRALPSGASIDLIGDYPTQRRNDGALLTKDLARDEITRAIEQSLKNRSSPITVNFTAVQAPKAEVKVSNRYLIFDCGVSYLVDHDFYRMGSGEIEGPEELILSRLNTMQGRRARDRAGAYTGYSPSSARVEGQVAVQSLECVTLHG
ncbi:MAG: hypothetical protein QM630_05410 [Microbacterium sp.]